MFRGHHQNSNWRNLAPEGTCSDLAMSFPVFVVAFIRVPVGQSCFPVSVPFTCLIPLPLVLLGRRDRDKDSYCVLITKDAFSVFVSNISWNPSQSSAPSDR